MFLIGINIGFIKVLIFLFHQWGGLGILAGLTLIPPIVICPVWEWVVTGHWVTFLFVYGFGFGGYALVKTLDE